MLTGKTNTVHSHPNLLLLREALNAAESGVPAYPPRVDSHEQRAIQLIERMRAEYKRESLFFGLYNIPSPLGTRVNVRVMTSVHAG